MATIDNRVVSMVFDNSRFEGAVQVTLKTLATLKESLGFGGATKGLTDVQSAADRMDFTKISQGVDNISEKFSVWGAAALVIVSRVTNSIIDAGQNLVKQFTVDQAIAGLKEYEVNMNSIQTVLANTAAKGTKLKDVNAALDELNHYSDKTIYNFSEMARNVGTFTAAGVDLQTSVSSIKGIANLAAVSGSSAEQASVAMYQLSQALASGTVKLMDWNSVVNAGMGGQVFQNALYETGKAMGTLKNIPMGETFEQWKKKGNSFRESLKDGWITTEVLSKTLQTFTGDYTNAQLKAMGYNDKQIASLQQMGKTATEAATKVKTFSQLISTVEEAIGSGWSASFRLIIGDFDEARKMFTDFNNFLGGLISTAANARNALLQGWHDLGGRDTVIKSVMNVFTGLVKIIHAVKEAFHGVWSPATSNELYNITYNLQQFTEKLVLSDSALSYVKRTLRGFFSIISIGVEVLKGIKSSFETLFEVLYKVSGAEGGNILPFLAGVGDTISGWKKALVDGGGIEAFFDKFNGYIRDQSPLLEKIVGWFGKLKDVFDGLVKVFDFIVNGANRLITVLSTVSSYLSKFVGFILDKFGGLGKLIADELGKIDYKQAVDAVNVGFLGSLTLMFLDFMRRGIRISFDRHLIRAVVSALKSLTDTFRDMQAKLKADSLKSIASAIAIVAASLLVLSMIDSAALSKAMIALGTGMGILVGALKVIDKAISGGVKNATRLATVTSALSALGTAVLTLAIATKIFSTMSWDEMARGLTGVTVVLGALFLFVDNLSKGGARKHMIGVGLGLIGVAIALNILAGAVKLFSMMSWAELGKGFAAVAAGLLAIGIAMELMPNGPNLALKGAGMLEIAIALNILAGAVKLFSMMSWEAIGKGMAAITVGLLGIALALNFMPNGVNLTLQGAGLFLVGLALLEIAKSMEIVAKLSWTDIAKGLVSIGGALAILAVTLSLMEGSVAGALALAIAAGSLVILTHVLKDMSEIGWGELVKGLAAIAAILGVLALAANLMAEALPAMLTLGAALILIGGGMALLGLGLNLVATSWSIFLTSTAQNIGVLGGLLGSVIKAIPGFLVALVKGIVAAVAELLKALPGIIKNLGVIIVALLDLIIQSLPKIVETLVAIILAALDAIKQTWPQIQATGFELLITLLKGIRDNIGEVTNIVIDIIMNFLTAITDRLGDIIAKGFDLLVAFLKGITDNIGRAIAAAGEVIGAFIKGLGGLAGDIVKAGADALVSFLEGIASAIPRIASAITDVIKAFLKSISDETPKVVDAFFQMFIDLFNGLADEIRKRSGELGKALGNLVSALVDGIGNALKEAIKEIANDLFPGMGYVVSGILDFFGIASPSKLFHWIGTQLMVGFQNGINNNLDMPKNALDDGAASMVNTMQDTMSKISDVLAQDINMDPTITPVLDLTGISKDAGRLNNILASSYAITPTASLNSANAIVTATNAAADSVVQNAAPTVTEIKFEQNNYSPEALSTADIYRQTRNQIAMAKGDLLLL